jgi:hypothetical protein
MKVYIVGDRGPEHNSVLSIHKNYRGALNAWNKLRLNLLNKAKKFLKNSDKLDKDMYDEMVRNLSCKDPKKIDNYPQETPYISEYKLEE